MITNEGKIADYNGKVIEKPIPPVVAIPTTAGTGARQRSLRLLPMWKKILRCC